MKFTFTDIKNLYHGCKFLGFTDGHCNNVYDCDCLFVVDSNSIIIAQFESMCDDIDERCTFFQMNKTFVDMREHHTIDLMEWLDGGATFKSF